MIRFDDLAKQKESELEEYLSRNFPVFPRRKSLAIRDNAVYQIFGRIEDRALVQTVYSPDEEELGTIYNVTIGGLAPISLRGYKRIVNSGRVGDTKGNKKWLQLILNKALKTVYPNSRFDIQSNSSIGFKVFVHYPEIKISNSMGIEHTIRDLFILYHFENDSSAGIYLSDLYAIKSTYTWGELRANYLHSHINRNDTSFSDSFCFGSTDFDSFISYVRNPGRNGNSDGLKLDDLIQLFLGMDSYLQWESIEGTPYRHIESIQEVNTSSISIAPITDVINDCYKEVVDKLESFNYTIKMVYNDSRIDITNNIEEVVKPILEEKYPEYLVPIQNGVPVRVITPNTNYDSLNSRTLFNFKGEPVKFRVLKLYNTQEEMDKIFPKRVLPALVTKVKSTLESEFEEFLLNKTN